VRHGRVLGYVADAGWLTAGAARPAAAMDVEIGGQVHPGAMTVAWWDADAGVVLREDAITHPGGRLVLASPPFARHIAFKLARTMSDGR
jgi:hypothetical protein